VKTSVTSRQSTTRFQSFQTEPSDAEAFEQLDRDWNLMYDEMTRRGDVIRQQLLDGVMPGINWFRDLFDQKK
jgi:hypothetical protein